MTKKLIKSNKGFTLIELLIVIVIIGILSGILVVIIDPTRQQNRAKDASVQAAINKVALSAEGHVSSYGEAADGPDFIAGLQNATAAPGALGAGCTTALSDSCLFSITGNALPAECAADGYTDDGTSSNQCYYRYERGITEGGTNVGTFWIVADSHGLARGRQYYYVNRGSDSGTIQTTDDLTIY